MFYNTRIFEVEENLEINQIHQNTLLCMWDKREVTQPLHLFQVRTTEWSIRDLFMVPRRSNVRIDRDDLNNSSLLGCTNLLRWYFSSKKQKRTTNATWDFYKKNCIIFGIIYHLYIIDIYHIYLLKTYWYGLSIYIPL